MTPATVGALSLALASGVPPGALAAVDALDAVTEDGSLIYLAPDGLTARAMDLASGAERWQFALQGADKVQAAVTHKLAPHRLLLRDRKEDQRRGPRQK